MDPSLTLVKGFARGHAARLGTCLAIALVVTAALASKADAIGTENSVCAPGANGFAIISFAGEWAQTFPAKRSGKLLTVELKGISRQPGTNGADIEVRLYGTEESGTPVDPVLDSTTIPAKTSPLTPTPTTTPRISRLRQPPTSAPARATQSRL